MATKKKVKQIKPGIYNAMIDKVTAHENGYVTVQMSLDLGKGTKCIERFTTKTVSDTIPAEGHTKYFIANSRLGIYTSIGADNLHHASNKATKLFSPSGWSFIRDERHVHDLLGYEAKIYKDYKELINTLSI